MSLFSLFCCCLRSRQHSLPDHLNETSPLIPPSDDVPCVTSDYSIFYLTDIPFSSRPAARHIIVDHQRMKERLGVIVRAKEGKMVNVNAPLPFNLNNTNNKRPRLSRLRARSPQPSVDTEHQSVVSSASASASALHELDDEVRWPTLNVRIVRGGSALARGRPITRDAIPPEPEMAEGEATGAGTEAAEQPAEAAVVRPSGAAEGAQASRMSGTTFKIQNVGSLSRSWGD
ncbi:hypothetical protein BJV78DRAFT_657555 [Lactifluus subvellereus]|nr:hypothetical protein BJV78DRAFT_657555 [Lactifluus subvellereus]